MSIAEAVMENPGTFVGEAGAPAMTGLEGAVAS